MQMQQQVPLPGQHVPTAAAIGTEKSKRDEQRQQKSEQYDMQQAYLKATAEQKQTGKFFRDLPIEQVVDFEAI